MKLDNLKLGDIQKLKVANDAAKKANKDAMGKLATAKKLHLGRRAGDRGGIQAASDNRRLDEFKGINRGQMGEKVTYTKNLTLAVSKADTD